MLQVTYLDYWSNCLVMFPRANMGWTLLLVYILFVYDLCSLPEKLYLQHSCRPEGKEGYKTRGCSYLQTFEKEISEKGKILVRVVLNQKPIGVFLWCLLPCSYEEVLGRTFIVRSMRGPADSSEAEVHGCLHKTGQCRPWQNMLLSPSAPKAAELSSGCGWRMWQASLWVPAAMVAVLLTAMYKG